MKTAAPIRLEDLVIAPAAGYLATKAMEPVSTKLYELKSDADRRREDAARPGPARPTRRSGIIRWPYPNRSTETALCRTAPPHSAPRLTWPALQVDPKASGRSRVSLP